MSCPDTPVGWQAQGNVNRIYDADRARPGYLPNDRRV